METKEDILMIRYLLGQMTELEQSQIEERYFHDPDFYIQLLAVEEELMGDYAYGHLSPPERTQFEQHFLAAPHRRQKYERTKAWLTFISAASLPATSPASPVKERLSWLKSLGFPSPAFQAALVATMLVMIAGGAWLIVQTVRLQGQLKRSETQRAALEQQAQESQRQVAEQRAHNELLAAELERRQDELEELKLSPAKPPGADPGVFDFALNTDLTRSVEGAQPLSLSSDIHTVRLSLSFEAAAHDYPAYQAVLLTVTREELWRSKAPLKARTTKPGGEVVLNLPATRLTKGAYIVQLNGVTAAGKSELVRRYSFKVDRK